MASWQHINMLGEYDFSDERVNTTNRRFLQNKINSIDL